ncbi:DUF4412 domain-containing protein [Aureispira anguillae]|uniref:DUF4412 domain-containing protein n=1 Tax=Aureispira anguillae TaxID=2864201 RepID=A0A915YFB0_9BACT|nr:DUF4412 domain-containing protein [Aureispira anguillae]BDS12068.1 DUF4412 domain-containing protein [Aureispira anguillae]
MNKITLLLIVFLASSTVVWAQTFEGIIEMHQVTSNGLEYDLKWYIKGDKIAYELSSASSRGEVQMRCVPQKSTNSMLMISGNTKRVIPASDITSPIGFSMEGAKLQNKGTVKHKDFSSVQHWEISTAEIVADVEITTDVKINFSEYKEFFKSDYGLCALAELGQEGFPLSSVTKDKNGNVLTKTTLKKVTRTTLSDSYFK